MKKKAVISIVGWHNSGKTTFITQLLSALKRRGLRVATIKHARSDFEIDRPGTDTWRYAQAGSDLVIISGQGKRAMIQYLEGDPSLEETLALVPDAIDVVLVEGYKRASVPKIEILSEKDTAPRISTPEDLVALISSSRRDDEEIPTFAFTDLKGVIALLEERGFLPKSHTAQ